MLLGVVFGIMLTNFWIKKKKVKHNMYLKTKSIRSLTRLSIIVVVFTIYFFYNQI